MFRSTAAITLGIGPHSSYRKYSQAEGNYKTEKKGERLICCKGRYLQIKQDNKPFNGRLSRSRPTRTTLVSWYEKKHISLWSLSNICNINFLHLLQSVSSYFV